MLPQLAVWSVGVGYGGYMVKLPQSILLIPQEYVIQERINAAVMEERERYLRIIGKNRDQLEKAQQAMHSLECSLLKVHHAALWARGEELRKALEGMGGVISGKFINLKIVASPTNWDVTREAPEFVTYIANVINGIEMAVNSVDNGEYLRQLGLSADIGGYDYLLTIRNSIRRGSRPVSSYRMILAARVYELQNTPKKPTYKAVLDHIQHELEASQDLEEEWKHILVELRKRSGSNRDKRVPWISGIMAEYREQIGQLLE